jgi:hypothetical protein
MTRRALKQASAPRPERVALVEASDVTSEGDFQTSVVRQARLLGWMVYYVPDSRRSPEGYPDLTLARNGVVHHWEMKAAKGRVSPAQEAWLHHLGPSARVLRPSDMDEIEAILRLEA